MPEVTENHAEQLGRETVDAGGERLVSRSDSPHLRHSKLGFSLQSFDLTKKYLVYGMR